ncbi:MAG: hypothetical protein A2831_01460 [Candidatus Yanofskybacteria bacterium RIFCSPHIGHO2_01_FULL_44_17]|uniref:Zinc finger DksA/TraR C4-type domain-containing protein n=1 Tax=Candidatus Yanofskybacteria bacterium RIFCSPHIGHO2_01_FULL_44_17 TaxID=1802668 RepID=A0A1F8EWZ6_9BACT|nr:MAG: hypothetical protein A2831_01460 [Candidatus Yanofskybacteria bacterium RIFCSPHIGHO2_01_FULL_44_17]
MTPQELKNLRESLVTEMGSLENQLGEFTSENPIIKGDRRSHFHETDPSDSPSDKAHSVTEFEEERAVEQNLELRLRQIRGTIKKIDDGTYGVCENCVLPIDARRLQVVSVARLCVDCSKKIRLA